MDFCGFDKATGNKISSRETADRLRGLAREVRRIGDGYRHDPEAIAIQKDGVASRLIAIARELDTTR